MPSWVSWYSGTQGWAFLKGVCSSLVSLNGVVMKQ